MAAVRINPNAKLEVTRHPKVLVLGTLDTKREEFLFLKSCLEKAVDVLLINAGRIDSDVADINITVKTDMMMSLYANTTRTPDGQPTTKHAMTRAFFLETLTRSVISFIRPLAERKIIHAIVGAGGSGNTSLVASVAREALPLGFPKLIVSTVASADVSSYVGETDLTLMHSVVDIAGLNPLLRGVLSNAAAAVAGMATSYFDRTGPRAIESSIQEKKSKRTVAISMFGVTTPAVNFAVQYLQERDVETYVFHAVGSGGRAMERMIQDGLIDGVLDLTTTELADELVGGCFSAGPRRLTVAAHMGIPQVVSVGALDIVNFGPRNTVPKVFETTRTLSQHSESITLMRTSPEECKKLGHILVERLLSCVFTTEKEAQGWDPHGDTIILPKSEIWLPLRGISALSIKNGPFFDPRADAALFQAIRSVKAENVRLVIREFETHINDREFAEGMAKRLYDMMEGKLN